MINESNREILRIKGKVFLIDKSNPLAMSSDKSFIVEEPTYTVLKDLFARGIRKADLRASHTWCSGVWEQFREGNHPMLSSYSEPLPLISGVYAVKYSSPIARPLSSARMSASWVPIMPICQRSRNVYLEICELASLFAKDSHIHDKFEKIKRELRIIQRTHYKVDEKLRKHWDEYYYVGQEFDETGLAELNPIGSIEWFERVDKVKKEYGEENEDS